MKRLSSTILPALCFMVAGISILLVSTVDAQSNPGTNSAQALEIGPPIVNIKGDPGEIVKAQISLRDVADNPLVVSNELNDFTADGESGAPKLLLNDSTPNSYSIIPWITPLPKFTLKPKQIQKLDIVVKIPENASPGGYYGVIRFTGTPPGVDGSGVSLSASVGTLVFVRVNGQAKEQMSVQEFFASGNNGSPGWFFDAPPINLSIRLKNDGNVFERPTGSVTITDMFGQSIGTLGYNQTKDLILPDTIRKFTRTIDKSLIGNKFLFGKYTANVEMTYGDSGQKLTSTLSFWVIPWKLILTVIIGLIALFILVRFILYRYKQRVLKQSSRGRRR